MKWICTKCAWQGSEEETDPVMYRGVDWQNCPSCQAVAIPAGELKVLRLLRKNIAVKEMALRNLIIDIEKADGALRHLNEWEF